MFLSQTRSRFSSCATSKTNMIHSNSTLAETPTVAGVFAAVLALEELQRGLHAVPLGVEVAHAPRHLLPHVGVQLGELTSLLIEALPQRVLSRYLVLQRLKKR